MAPGLGSFKGGSLPNVSEPKKKQSINNVQYILAGEVAASGSAITVTNDKIEKVLGFLSFQRSNNLIVYSC